MTALDVPSRAPLPDANLFQGVALGFLTYGVFACCDAAIKSLGGRLPVFEIGFFSILFSCLPIAFGKPKTERWRDLFRMERPKLVALRAACGMGSGVFAVIAFTTVPLAEAYALVFLMPFFVTLLSVLCLREAVGWRRWLALLVGLAGVLLVVRPGFKELHPGHLAAAAAGFCAAGTVLTLRVLAGSERRVTLIGIVTLGGLLLNGTLMLFDFRVPEWRDLATLALAGVLGGMGHLGLMAAMRLAPANRVAPAQYSQIVWAVGLGALFFAERPDAVALSGIALVAACGLFTFLREERRAPRAMPLPRGGV